MCAMCMWLLNLNAVLLFLYFSHWCQLCFKFCILYSYNVVFLKTVSAGCLSCLINNISYWWVSSGFFDCNEYKATLHKSKVQNLKDETQNILLGQVRRFEANICSTGGPSEEGARGAGGGWGVSADFLKIQNALGAKQQSTGHQNNNNEKNY